MRWHGASRRSPEGTWPDAEGAAAGDADVDIATNIRTLRSVFPTIRSLRPDCNMQNCFLGGSMYLQDRGML